jgi:hypothetical protein
MEKSCLLCGMIVVGAALIAVPARSAASDVSGDWTYEVSDSWKKGPCPVGKGGSGAIRITLDDDAAKLVFASGRTCRPKSMCTFAGTLSGEKLVVSNSARVDDEGGVAKNEIKLTFTGGDAASGTSESSYTHPGGMECHWGSKLKLTR